MNMTEYVNSLERSVDPALVENIKDWPVDTKLYMYLHNIQLSYMAEYRSIAEKILEKVSV